MNELIEEIYRVKYEDLITHLTSNIDMNKKVTFIGIRRYQHYYVEVAANDLTELDIEELEDLFESGEFIEYHLRDTMCYACKFGLLKEGNYVVEY